MPMKAKAILIAIFLSCAGYTAGAEQKTQIKDSKSGYVLTLDTSQVWQTDNQSGRDGITACAVAPEATEPFATICVKTLPQVHKKALSDTDYASELIRGLLDGLCKPFQCEASPADKSEPKTHGALSGWQLTTNLELAAYKNAGLSGTVFFASVSPAGQLQLFSLHTARDQTDRYYDLLTSAISSIDYSK